MVTLLAIVILLMTGEAVWAQSDRRPVEVSVGIAGIHSVMYEDFGISGDGAAVDFRVTVPVSRRFALEGGMALARRIGPFERRIDGLYSVSLRQRLLRLSDERTDVFLSYGAFGVVQHRRVPPYTLQLPGGGWKEMPGFSYTNVDEPYGVQVGGGVQRQLGRRFAWRAEAEVMAFAWIPLGVRVSTSLSIPLGRYGDAP